MIDFWLKDMLYSEMLSHKIFEGGFLCVYTLILMGTNEELCCGILNFSIFYYALVMRMPRLVQEPTPLEIVKMVSDI